MAKGNRKYLPWVPVDGGAFAAGGQGDVFVVRHQSGDPPGEYVLKWLRNPERQQRFDNELKSLSAVAGHPNVVRLIDPGAYQDQAARFYVMEKADASLERGAPSGGYDPARSLAIFSDVLAGIKALHEAKIVHRDIKPDNVLLFGEVAKIADTGLCLIVGEPRPTPTKEAVGPRFYMAPELEHGRNLKVDARADIYSLGKLLYWLLSGGVHLHRENHRQRGYRLEQNVAPGLGAFDRIFERTLTVEPSVRFRGIDELISAFASARRDFEDHADTRCSMKLGKARSFQSAFTRLRADEKQAALHRAKLGLLSVSADDLIQIAERDRRCRNAELLALIDAKIAPEDARIQKLALTFGGDDEGHSALTHARSPRRLTRALVQAFLRDAPQEMVVRFASRRPTPFLEFDDQIPALLARLPPPTPMPRSLVDAMAVFPRLTESPCLVEVMSRAADDPGVDDETDGMIVLALARSTDPKARPILERLIDARYSSSGKLHQIIEPLTLAGRSDLMRDLSVNAALSDHDNRLFALAADLAEHANRARVASVDDDKK